MDTHGLTEWMRSMRRYRTDAAPNPVVQIDVFFNDELDESDEDVDSFDEMAYALSERWNEHIEAFIGDFQKAIRTLTIGDIENLKDDHDGEINYSVEPWTHYVELVNDFQARLATFAGVLVSDLDDDMIDFISYFDFFVETYVAATTSLEGFDMARAQDMWCEAARRAATRQLFYDYEWSYGPEVYQSWEHKNLAAATIQRVWRWCVSDPNHPICQRRIKREFSDLQTA